ncbi:hypothetical protein C7212DRAFT_341713 [Tuber magnatum]|uniref:Uncharacterized protein n=1 Tax=Tuber magnatum TaxID=42249 RepID=A0A317SY91_9PEZI|nr:hypothetical protein C7212DRAFT_341713 [Tuber magnatum]
MDVLGPEKKRRLSLGPDNLMMMMMMMTNNPTSRSLSVFACGIRAVIFHLGRMIATVRRIAAAGQDVGTAGGGAGYNPRYGGDNKGKENPAPLPPGSGSASSAGAGGGGDSFDDFMASVAAGGYIDGGQPIQFMDDFLGEFSDSVFPGT